MLQPPATTSKHLLRAKQSLLAVLVLCGLILTGSAFLVASDNAAVNYQALYDQGLLDTKDKSGLPRVLIVGDSISIYYTVATRGLLQGKANLHHIPVNGGDTDFGLKNIPSWLGTGKWDVIYCNWGLHDLVIKPNGQHEVPLERYESNLRAIVKILKRTGATLAWATTTPVPQSLKGGPKRQNADVIAYNAAALQIMRNEGVEVDDLYHLALPRLKELQRPENVHFTVTGSDVLARHVAQTILHALGSR